MSSLVPLEKIERKKILKITICDLNGRSGFDIDL